MARTRMYRHGKLEAEDFPVAEVSECLELDGSVVWVDLSGPSKADLHELADELGLHELAVEDALGPHQRPKVDYYDTHLFLACHAVRLDDEAGELIKNEIDAFISKRWLVTVHKNDDFDLEPVLARWDRSPDLAAHGVAFLLYGFLDVVVDGYFDAVSAFDDYYDMVSEALFSDRPLQPHEQQHWFQMRQALVTLNRVVGPMREAVSGLMRREHDVLPAEIYPYYQDVYDHTLRASESTDALRELVSTIVETNLSLRDYRQNQIMKKVTSWAAIIAIPTLITGWFGMNVPYPGSGRSWGVVFALVTVLICSGVLYIVFRRREWL